MDVHRLSGISSGELAGCAGRVWEKLNNAALEDGASKEDLLRAALAASNDRYEKAVQEQNARLDRLEAAVRASNEQRAIDVQGALKNAAEAILGDVRTESAAYIKAMDEAAARLNAAHKKKARNDAWEALKELALIVAAFAIGGYIANWAFGWWYDIPLKVDAINNALYQLLSKP